jgi:hypothetical protein
MSTGDEARSRNRKLRFTLRSLLVAITIACFFFAYPRFLSGVMALLSGVFIAGGVFTIFILIPVFAIGRFFHRQTKESNIANHKRR